MLNTHKFESWNAQTGAVMCTCGWRTYISSVHEARAEFQWHVIDILPGSVVMVQGYEFRVVRAWSMPMPTEGFCFHFVGVCTDNPRNDDIRNTGYNNAVYSWRAGEPLVPMLHRT